MRGKTMPEVQSYLAKQLEENSRIEPLPLSNAVVTFYIYRCCSLHKDVRTCADGGSFFNYYSSCNCSCFAVIISLSLLSFQNMPFDFNNKYAFTVKAILYFGTAVWIPFYVVRHQMKRAVSA